MSNGIKFIMEIVYVAFFSCESLYFWNEIEVVVI